MDGWAAAGDASGCLPAPASGCLWVPVGACGDGRACAWEFVPATLRSHNAFARRVAGLAFEAQTGRATVPHSAGINLLDGVAGSRKLIFARVQRRSGAARNARLLGFHGRSVDRDHGRAKVYQVFCALAAIGWEIPRFRNRKRSNAPIFSCRFSGIELFVPSAAVTGQGPGGKDRELLGMASSASLLSRPGCAPGGCSGCTGFTGWVCLEQERGKQPGSPKRARGERGAKGRGEGGEKDGTGMAWGEEERWGWGSVLPGSSRER